MWPFNKDNSSKYDEKKLEAKEKAFHEYIKNRENILFEKLPIGKRADYLNRVLIVVDHQSYKPGISGGYYSSPTIYTRVFCEYVDDHGQIRSLEFNLQQAEILLCKEKPDVPKPQGPLNEPIE